MIVYELAENSNRKGLYATVEGARGAAQRILNGYKANLIEEAEALQADPDEAMLMEQFTVLPGEPLVWAKMQHYHPPHWRKNQRGPRVKLGEPVLTAWYTERSCFTIHERKIHG